MNQILSFPSPGVQELPAGTLLLNGQYRILQHLQQGGFANTYLAMDSLNRQVVIKECFPTGICERARGRVRAVSPALAAQFETLKRQFINEARTMATLRHPNIVAVHQVFEENDSAYMALDFVAGVDLITLLEEQPERLTPSFLETSLRQALEAVRYIHAQGILHRDIAPDNIRVDAAGWITLIDFGAARDQAAGPDPATAPLVAVKDGYSPYEFYRTDRTQDGASDLYSLAATFFHLITGDAPPNAETRMRAVEAGLPDLCRPLAERDGACSYALLHSIDLALQVHRQDRPKSAEAWLLALDSLPRQRPAPVRAADTAGPVLDADLVRAVSELVRETNADLVAHVPGTGRRPGSQHPAAKRPVVRPPRKRWYDLSGTPIDNLDVWMTEQEREAQRRAAPVVVAPAPPPPPPAAEPAPEPAAKAAAPEPARGVKSLVSGLGLRSLYRNLTPTAT